MGDGVRETREIIGGEWTLAYDHFDPSEEGLREALTSTGNGYFCTRGTVEWADADGTHYPGTYMHGGFNRETTIMAGRPVVNEDLVNLPNWLVMKLMIDGEEPIELSNAEILSYRHELLLLGHQDHAQRATGSKALAHRPREGSLPQKVLLYSERPVLLVREP